jgi:hypothetical protein
MSAVADIAEQVTVLRGKAEQVEALIDAPFGVRAVDARADRRWAWYQALEDAVLDLSNVLPEGTEDYDARKLLEFLVSLRRAIALDADAGDAAGEVELATMALRDVARRLGRRLEHDELDDPNLAARAIFAALRGVGVADLGRLLGVSTKTVNGWRAGKPVARNARRVVVLAQLLTYLRASMTPVGLMLWFDAPRAQLGGRTPLALLDEDAATAHERLVALARGARGQLAG